LFPFRNAKVFIIIIIILCLIISRTGSHPFKFYELQNDRDKHEMQRFGFGKYL